MPKPGSRRSRPKFSAKAAAACLLSVLAFAAPGKAQDELPSLTGAPGDPARGRAIVASRQLGLCTLCHSGPLPEAPFQGDLAPDLRGVGARWSENQIRLRIVDSRRVNPDTIMPPYGSLEGLTRVAPNWRGKTILTAEQIEDVVAYLTTLKE
jgi:L-cysteine S-thiosulfotransferase